MHKRLKGSVSKLFSLEHGAELPCLKKRLGHFITTSVSKKVAKVILNKMAKVHFTEWPQEYLMSQST